MSSSTKINSLTDWKCLMISKGFSTNIDDCICDTITDAVERLGPTAKLEDIYTSASKTLNIDADGFASEARPYINRLVKKGVIHRDKHGWYSIVR